MSKQPVLAQPYPLSQDLKEARGICVNTVFYHLVGLHPVPQRRALWDVGLDWAGGLIKANLLPHVCLRVRTAPACPQGTGKGESSMERGMLLSPSVAWEWALAGLLLSHMEPGGSREPGACVTG